MSQDLSHLLGRDTAETIRTAPVWKTLVRAAPHVFSGAGEAAQASPPIYKYCPGGYQNQSIGCCVGMGSANAVMTILRIPDGAEFHPEDDSRSTPPLPTARVSALFNYWNARNFHGRSSFGEGAVVAYAMDAVKARGVLPYASWPDTDAGQASYRDGRPPSDEDFTEAATHKVLSVARVTSGQQVLDYLSQGYPVVCGVPIGADWQRPNADGSFSLGGGTIGGHCFVLVGFDKRLNRVYVRNSWAAILFGMPTDEPEFADAGGHDNVGFAPMDEFINMYFSERDFESGSTDAFVVSARPEGFSAPTPIIKKLSAVELFT